MRTKLTPKEVRAIALDGGEGWLVLADLAREYGNEELAKSATRAFDGTIETNHAAIKLLHLEEARTVAVRAARRALERERSAGREPDKRSWTAVEAVEAGVRGDDLREVVSAAFAAAPHVSTAAYSAAYSSAFSAASAASAAISAYYAADAAAYAANGAKERRRRGRGRGQEALSRRGDYEELAIQLADIFEVWWESVCARS